MRLRLLFLLALLPLATSRAEDAPPTIKFSVPPPPPPAPVEPDSEPEPDETVKTPPEAEPVAAPASEAAQPVSSIFELQVELHRRGFSCGSIDGTLGLQTASALRAWQRQAGLRDTGVLDEATRGVLTLTAPAWKEHVFSAEELAALQPVPETWLGKSQVESLAYATALEFAAERYRASPKFLEKNNPGVDWTALKPGDRIQVPAIERVKLAKNVARILIWLAARELEVVDEDGTVLAHFPVSIARMAEKRPVGELHVKVVIPDPNYTLDPAVFPESQEAQELGRKLILPPGPNNPVGLAWIGLDRPGYGIHGTPSPEQVGRTESHGCFRLANWDAVALLPIVKVGLPVIVEP